MRTLSLALQKVEDISESGVFSLGFEIPLPSGAEYNGFKSGTLFESVNCGIKESNGNLLIGAQNTSTPVLNDGHVIDIEFSAAPSGFQPTIENVFAMDGKDNDIILEIEIGTLLISTWKLIGEWV